MLITPIGQRDMEADAQRERASMVAGDMRAHDARDFGVTCV